MLLGGGGGEGGSGGNGEGSSWIATPFNSSQETENPNASTAESIGGLMFQINERFRDVPIRFFPQNPSLQETICVSGHMITFGQPYRFI